MIMATKKTIPVVSSGLISKLHCRNLGKLVSSLGFAPLDPNRKRVKLPTEQYLNQKALFKPNGWLASDVSKFMRATSFMEFQALLSEVSRLPQAKTDGMTVEQVIHATKPRIIDLPHERKAFAEWYFDTTGNSIDDLFVNSTDNVKGDENNPEPSPASSPGEA